MSRKGVKELKSFVNGDEMDLSSQGLTDPPKFADLIKFTEVTSIDLASNSIVALPNEFCVLPRLEKLDLSGNQLVCLPDNIGALANLRKLDLYDNKISFLPLSFARLKNLQSLDLSNNPLEEELKRAVSVARNARETASLAIKYMTIKAAEHDAATKTQKKIKKKAINSVYREVNDHINEKIGRENVLRANPTRNVCGPKENVYDERMHKKEGRPNEKRTAAQVNQPPKEGSFLGVIGNVIKSVIKTGLFLTVIYAALVGFNCYKYSEKPTNVFLPNSAKFCQEAISSINTQTWPKNAVPNLVLVTESSYKKFVLPRLLVVREKLDHYGVNSICKTTIAAVQQYSVKAIDFASDASNAAVIKAKAYSKDVTVWYNKKGYKYVQSFKAATFKLFDFVMEFLENVVEVIVKWFGPAWHEFVDLVYLLVNDRDLFVTKMTNHWNTIKASVTRRV
uniref:Leucine-rich repeat-containing protein 59 n=1 Tax=Rhabditophanes sp. KR3021 TaxID=114890 RepID=A0AC35U8T4_9BILA